VSWQALLRQCRHQRLHQRFHQLTVLGWAVEQDRTQIEWGLSVELGPWERRVKGERVQPLGMRLAVQVQVQSGRSNRYFDEADQGELAQGVLAIGGCSPVRRTTEKWTIALRH
jgi:hypothetical protein